MESRITELEIRLAHQEHTLEVLNDTIITQHREIDQLKLQLSALEKRLKSLSHAESLVAHESEETPPPHY